MLFNYLKTAYRNIFRNKRSSLIIIFSLAVAFSFTSLLFSFIVHEKNTDAFHHDKDRMYRLFSNDPMGGEGRIRVMKNATREYIVQHYPEVEQACIITSFPGSGTALGNDQEMFDDIRVLSVSDSFFDVFDYPFTEGVSSDAFRNGGIVLSEKTAQKVLGDPPYLNRNIEFQKDTTRHMLQVTAVVSNQAEHTQFRFDALVAETRLQASEMGVVVMRIREGADPENLIGKVNSDENVPGLLGAGNTVYSAEPFSATYFNQESVLPFERSRSSRFIWICWIVVFLISFAAGFNFVNLFVIGMTTRSKELGMRKISGATESGIGFSISVEIGLYILISVLLSLVLTIELLPYFNAAFDTRLTLSVLTQGEFIVLMVSFVVLIGILLSVYLLYYLRRLDLIHLLQGTLIHKIKVNKFLFTAQFAVASGLIICSSIVVRQMEFIQNKPLGFNRHLVEVSAPNQHLGKQMPVLKNRLLQYPEFTSKVALSSGNPISGNWQTRLEIDENTVYSPYLISGDRDLPDILHLQVIDGESYREKENSGKLVNEKLVRLLGIENPVNKKIPGTDDTISGVVRDFNSVSLKQDIPPYIISYNKTPTALLVDVSELAVGDALPMIAEGWEEVFPGYIFDYKLIHDELLAKHEADIQFFRILISFTLASILISCFGLYGIASFTTAQRTKEIGIRKVLGASAAGIVALLSKDYLKRVLIGFVIAIPVAWHAMNQWLADFAYKIDVGPGVFVIAGGAALLFVLLTVSWQSVKAAVANPAKSLRTE